MAKRSIGKRRIRLNGVREETGFSSDAAEAEALRQIRTIDADLGGQMSRTDAVLERSNTARQKLVDKGLFGGLS